MSNILLVEPAYRSKFPPLGLMRISTYHKGKGDLVTFVRGKVPEIRDLAWHKIYVSSLFTYELPRTVDTIQYYSKTVQCSSRDIYVGGIGATLLPSYIRDLVDCKIIEGPLDQPDILGDGIPPIAHYVPDYDLLKSVNFEYKPKDSYFFRVTVGCIRKCAFCAVPKLEPNFGFSCSLEEQMREVKEKFGERQNMVLMDNNILAIDNLENIIGDIRRAGFASGESLNGRHRTVDFNQGIDARLITPELAQLLSTISLDPVRLAFDFLGMERQYRKAVKLLANVGFEHFTNYVMFNYNDDPESLYRRIRINLELSQKHNIQITSFPMRFVPIDDVNRHFVSEKWHWRYLRGIQCVLNATHGIVSPNVNFVDGSFGKSFDEFLEILSMPDRYIIYRKNFQSDAEDWKSEFRKLTKSEKDEFLVILAKLNKSKQKQLEISQNKKYLSLFEHYYPNGKWPNENPKPLEN